MLVLYPVLVLSVIAGHGRVFANDADAPTTTPSPAPSAAETVTTSTTAKTELPSKTDALVREPSASKKEETSKTKVDDKEEAPMADDYDSVDKGKLATTLERITKVLDANPSVKSTAAVPLLPGKHFDFFLLKVPKHEEESKAVTPRNVVSRNLDFEVSGNSMSSPDLLPGNTVPLQSGTCPCLRPPPQVASDLNVLRGIYGNALNFDAMLDRGCPPGLVTAFPMRMMPAIDGIPVSGLASNSLGQGIYSQYSPSPSAGYQQMAPNYYPTQNSYTPLLPYQQGGAQPPTFAPSGANQQVSYPQVGPNLPSFYIQSNAQPSYPQNGYYSEQFQTFLPPYIPQLDTTGMFPYGPANTPSSAPTLGFSNPNTPEDEYYPTETQRPHKRLSKNFPASFGDYIQSDYKSAKSLDR